LLGSRHCVGKGTERGKQDTRELTGSGEAMQETLVLDNTGVMELYTEYCAKTTSHLAQGGEIKGRG
jgi:hypothetical protein